jgi:hypothetical protein
MASDNNFFIAEMLLEKITQALLPALAVKKYLMLQ